MSNRKGGHLCDDGVTGAITNLEQRTVSTSVTMESPRKESGLTLGSAQRKENLSVSPGGRKADTKMKAVDHS